MNSQGQYADEEAADPPEKNAYWEALEKRYWERRRYLQEGARYHSRALDNHILTLSSGVLAFSAVFMSSKADFSVWGSGLFLALTWFFLFLAISFALCSLLYGRAEYDHYISDLDARYKERRLDQPPEKYARAWVTCLLTRCALLSFILGLLVLIVSGALIMLSQPKGGENVGRRRQTTTNSGPQADAANKAGRRTT